MLEDLRTCLTAVSSGDEKAFSRLAEEYAPLTHSVSGRFFPSFAAVGSELTLQDLEQEARVALYRAAKTFDVTKDSVTFGLYAKVCIQNALTSLYRKAKKPIVASVSPEGNAVSHWMRQRLPEGSEVEAEALKERIRGELSPYENRIFEKYISGRPVRKIAEDMGRPEKSVSNALYRVRTKVKGLLTH